MKRIIGFLLCSALVLCMAGCSSTEPSLDNSETTTVTSETSAGTTASESTAESTAETTAGSDTLVIYFSATGTTKNIAEKIAENTDADLYEITAAVPYTDADRNWKDSGSRCSVEQDDTSARPEISSEHISLEGYKTIYIGYPIWFGQAPRIMDTFVESYSFEGITVIPFCTSGSSGIGQSGKNLAANAGSGNWLEGKRFDADASKDDIIEWIKTQE